MIARGPAAAGDQGSATRALSQGAYPATPPAAPRYPWRGRAWADMPKWQRLCAVLDDKEPENTRMFPEIERGPKTTGELGHIYGLGENVRGIRREANVHLRRLGLEIMSEETVKRDAKGDEIHNATYRLVDKLLAEPLKRTAKKVKELRDGRKASRVALTHEIAGSTPAPAASFGPCLAAQPVQRSMF